MKKINEPARSIDVVLETDVLIDAPTDGVRLAMVTTGAGASTGFGLGEEVVSQLFGETGI